MERPREESGQPDEIAFPETARPEEINFPETIDLGDGRWRTDLWVEIEHAIERDRIERIEVDSSHYINVGLEPMQVSGIPFSQDGYVSISIRPENGALLRVSIITKEDFLRVSPFLYILALLLNYLDAEAGRIVSVQGQSRGVWERYIRRKGPQKTDR